MLPQAGQSFVIYASGVVLLVGGMLAVSAILGERRTGARRASPYESGIAATGSSRVRLDVPFYLVAMLFVLFDLEVVFLFAWSVALRELGIAGFVGAMFFLIVLAVGLVYEWREGALDWAPNVERSLRGAASVRRDETPREMTL